MLKTRMFHGGVTNTQGLCPSCGRTVARTHAWAPGRAADTYACTSCGTFEYGTGDLQIPLQVTVAVTLPDLVDCVL